MKAALDTTIAGTAATSVSTGAQILPRLGVCTWSLQPESPEQLVDRLLQIGINKVQLALDPLSTSPQLWARTPDLLSQAGITILSGMFGCAGEDYSTLESIRLTGGVAPDATWDQNRAHIRKTADVAARLNLKLVTFHAGFLPHHPSDPTFPKMVDRLREIAQLFSVKDTRLGLETGQETADCLVQFLQELKQPNVGVNFDPANMILYGKGNPIQALRDLGPWVKQVHIKDATCTTVPGQWGQEVPAGTGQVPWPEFFRTLRDIPFSGPMVIEREAGNQRIDDIRAARDMVLRTAV